MSKLLVENLLRFGAKGLTKSKVFKYLTEQGPAEYIESWRKREATANAISRAFRKIRNKGASIFIKSKELVPVTESPEGVTINFYNNFVTIDNGTPNPQQAKAAIDAVIEKFKQAGADLDDAATTITIRSGATSAKASAGVGQDGARAGKKQIDHRYNLPGDNWKTVFARNQANDDQYGNKILARLRGENVKKYMQSQGVKANIKVVPEINASQRFINIEGTTLGNQTVVTLTSLPKITVDIARSITLKVITQNSPEGKSLAGSSGDFYFGKGGGFENDKIERDYNQEVMRQDMDRKNNNMNPLSQEEKDKMMPEELIQYKWFLKAGKNRAVKIICNYVASVAYNNEYTGQYNTNGETKRRVKYTFANYGGNTAQAGTNHFSRIQWPSILKDLGEYYPGAVYKKPWTFGSGWTAPDNWSTYFGNGMYLKDLIRCVGHFTERAADKIHWALWMPSSKTTDAICGTNFTQTLQSVPKNYAGEIISLYWPGAANLPLPTVEQFPQLNSNRGKQVLKTLKQLKDEATAMSKYQDGDNILLNDKKTTDAKGLATAAAAGGIGGATPTIQYKPEYWTGGYFIDFTKKRKDGFIMPPIELKDAGSEIWSEIKALNLE